MNIKYNNNNKVVDIIYLDVKKVFDYIPHIWLIEKT